MPTESKFMSEKIKTNELMSYLLKIVVINNRTRFTILCIGKIYANREYIYERKNENKRVTITNEYNLRN